jgi:hypothetical protein
MDFKRIIIVIYFIILSGVEGLFLFECKSQDFSVGVYSDFSENKFVPAVFIEKKIRKKNYFQFSFAAGKFSDGYYPDQIYGFGKEPIFRERLWEVPYNNTGLTDFPLSNYVKIKGIRIQAGYLEYFQLRSRKHKIFWNLNINLNKLTDTFVVKDSLITSTGEFKFVSIGTSIRFGYRYILKQLHFTAFIGPTQYIDIYPGSGGSARSYPFVAPFVDLEMEAGISIGYSFFK